MQIDLDQLLVANAELYEAVMRDSGSEEASEEGNDSDWEGSEESSEDSSRPQRAAVVAFPPSRVDVEAEKELEEEASAGAVFC